MTTKITNEEDRVEMDLLHKIGAKDNAAFQELYRRYYGAVFATTLKVLQDKHDAEDVTQDVFAMLWQKASLFDSTKGRPLTWVVTLARNRSIDLLRSRQRRSRLNDDFRTETGNVEAPSSRDGGEVTLANEAGRILRSAVMELSKDQREAIYLAFFQSLTQSEVAEKLGEPLGTVKARIRRGIVRLRGIVLDKL